MSTTKVWYITGASKGIGLSLVRDLLAAGQSVAATSRDLKALSEAVAAPEGASFLPLGVDLSNEASVAGSIDRTIDQFGRIDVLVNNAGYGIGGALEELTPEEIGENFEVNFFAAVRVIRHAMPYLRRQRSGHIINISSIAGFAPGTGWSVYAAAKFALSGLSEALANDLKPFNIKVTSVAPGAFRTRFLKADSIRFSQHRIADYQNLRDAHDTLMAYDSKQLGDPDKVAAVFMQLVTDPNPPSNLFLGSDSLKRAKAKIEHLSGEIAAWEPATVSTDHKD